ncbi:MAG TPA: NIPSNAP family protein [Terriglobia bacterium]|nr:NIPSNAP family protein [Terriglobia bacterium]
MINRRAFLKRNASAALATAALAGPAPAGLNAETPGSRYLIEMVTFRLQNGGQVAGALGWLEKRAIPLWQKHRFGPVGVFTEDVGPHIPAVHFIRIYASLADREAAWNRLTSDAEWGAAVSDLEKDGPAFYREESVLLTSTPFSPPIRPVAPDELTQGIFELRIYETPTWRQLGYLHDRFEGGEIAIFHKSGIHPIFYADTLIGPNQPNMAYMIPFQGYAQRERAWATFRENPDWQKLRDESVRRGGEIVRNITNMILVPTKFSMIR